MQSEINSASRPNVKDDELYRVKSFNAHFDEADIASPVSSQALNLRIIEPEELVEGRAKNWQVAPAKSRFRFRDVTGSAEGGDRQIIGAPPPPETPPA